MGKRKVRQMILAGVGILVAAVFGFTLYFFTGLFSAAPENRLFKNMAAAPKTGTGIQVQLVRHATLIIIAGGKKILVDPMLGDPGTMPPFPLTAKRVRNPLVPLPISIADILKDLDAVLVTHNHSDHIDAAARTLLPKNIPLLCQPADRTQFERAGFVDIRPIGTKLEFDGLSLSRYPGSHGKDGMKDRLGPSSAYSLSDGKTTLYLTGDTLFDDQMESGLLQTQPQYIVANAGAAQFLFGASITLGADDLARMTQLVPAAAIMAVHMDAVNHCKLSRADLRSYLATHALATRIIVPEDGESIELTDTEE